MTGNSKLRWFTGLRGADLTDTEFRVLVILATFTDASMGNAYPGLANLVEAACVSRSAVKRALVSLQGKGWIRLAAEGGNHLGKGRANVYEIIPKGSTPEPLKGSTGGPLRASPRGPTDTPQGVQEKHLKGSTSGPPSGKNYQVISHQGSSAYVSNAGASDEHKELTPLAWIDRELPQGFLSGERTVAEQLLAEGQDYGAVRYEIMRQRRTSPRARRTS